ncbi:hypothetical protein OS493_011953 [Desmophyllum pertusum]|uniref:G-protein coupled receptors family 1 profile domain-containing protein n=1 Tax=Desmophyllum pertusum TaxID=174260 RepID=A0A9X0A2Q1_9CNID|nr:hypothetical protein OS493_011953 [Desmophyllum pertusum]
MSVISGNDTESNSSISSVSSACAIQPATLPLQIGLTVAYVVIFLVALLGNAMIIFLVNHYPELKTTFNMLIINMAASDILDVITAVPLSLAYLYQSVKWFPGGFGVFLCKFLPFLVFLSIGQVICAPRWVDDLQESHKVTMYEMIVRFALLYLIPLLAMAILYSRIVLHLWKRKAPGEHIKNNHQRIERQNRKVIVMLITIVTLFAICWLPAHVNHFLVTFNFDAFSCLPTSLILTFYFVTHANTAINPCLYLIFNESFRGAFKHQMHMRRRFSGGSITVSNSTCKSPCKTGSRAASGGATECRGILVLSNENRGESAV